MYVYAYCINMFKLVEDNVGCGLPSVCLDHTGHVGLLLAPLVMSQHGSTIIFITSCWLLHKAKMLFWKDCKYSHGNSGLSLACSGLTGRVGLLLAPLVMSRHGYNIILIASYWLPEKAEMLFWKNCKCSQGDSSFPSACSDCPWHH